MRGIDIDIIIPVYGVENYIKKFMDCLRRQTIQNFRLIFINDRTKDNSISIIKNYKTFFGERMVILENENNLGLSKTRNVGLEYASENPSKYLAFLDPDDWMDDDYLEDLYVNAEKYNLDLCISGLVRFNEETGKTICLEMTKLREKVFTSVRDCDELGYINPCAYSKMYRFSPIKDIRFGQIKRSEDTCFLFEALQHYKRIKFTNNAKYHYCVRGSSLTGTMGEDKYVSMHREFALLLPKFEKSNVVGLSDLFMVQIFIHSSIGGVCRLCFTDMSRRKELEKKELHFLDKYVGSWRKNKYLCFFRIKSLGVKPFLLKLCAQLYKVHLFSLFISIYYSIIHITGKDVRA